MQYFRPCNALRWKNLTMGYRQKLRKRSCIPARTRATKQLNSIQRCQNIIKGLFYPDRLQILWNGEQIRSCCGSRVLGRISKWPRLLREKKHEESDWTTKRSKQKGRMKSKKVSKPLKSPRPWVRHPNEGEVTAVTSSWVKVNQKVEDGIDKRLMSKRDAVDACDGCMLGRGGYIHRQRSYRLHCS